MGTTTELCGEISHSYNAHGIAVFFTEQGHCSCFLCLIKAHDIRVDFKTCTDLFIYDLLYLL